MPCGNFISKNLKLVLCIFINCLPEVFFSLTRMKQIDIGEGHALVVRENGVYTAVGHKCTHYGAPLIKGSLVNGKVRCPWHGACFNVKTGDIEDFPGLDSIPKFKVCVTLLIQGHGPGNMNEQGILYQMKGFNGVVASGLFTLYGFRMYSSELI